MKQKKKFGEVVIQLGQVSFNALKLLSAKYDMNSSQVITMALDDYYRKKLNGREKELLDDDMHCNHIIGELINANRGIVGYDPECNDIPDDKRHLLIEIEYDTMME